ncbi:MAG: Hsp20/alpha crystallin family protein [bacterium]|nr:Hsp20/alpha crystallin family protein [bacterium]
MPAIKQRIEPEICTYLDPETKILTIEVLFPNVNKEKIQIKIKNDALLIKAESEDAEYVKYVYLVMRLKKRNE